ncbi:MAG TPA: diacylglycerol kinase family protein [Candidatus Nanoarchaeia archaeon]|nr:diacylglycerol kinase family protein [Candidatus Nanoarchaeia archaeon]
MEDFELEELLSEKIMVVQNPRAGSKAKKIRQDIAKRLGNEHFNYVFSEKKGDITRIVSDRIAEAEKKGKKAMIMVVGGDGTYNEAVNANGDFSRVLFAFVDGGTSSDFARSLNLRSSLKACNLVNKIMQKRVYLEDYVKASDLIKVSYDIENGKDAKGRIVVESCKQVRALNLFSMGFDGAVCQRVNERYKTGGLLKKNIFLEEAIKVLKEYKPMEIVYSINDNTSKGNVIEDVLSLPVLNGVYAASGMKYNPYGEIDDGLLEALIVQKVRKRRIPSILRIVNLAWHIMILKDSKLVDAKPEEKGYNKYKVKYIDQIERIEMNILNADENKPYYFNVDGEDHKLDNPGGAVIVENLAKRINVLYSPESMLLPDESHRIFYDKRFVPPIFSPDSI